MPVPPDDDDLIIRGAGNFSIVHTQETNEPSLGLRQFMDKYGSIGQYSYGGPVVGAADPTFSLPPDPMFSSTAMLGPAYDAAAGRQLDMELANFKESGPGGYERAYIDHKKGGFRFSGSRPNMPKLDGLVLGMVKQRKLWKDQSSGAKGTYCSSPDAQIGVPKKDFPWEKFPQQGSMTTETIECDKCPMTHWKSEPRCQEKWYVPMWLHDDMVRLQGNHTAPVVIVEFTQSGITPMRQYFKDIVAANLLPFKVMTRIETQLQVHQKREFYVPKLTYSDDLNSLGVGEIGTEFTIACTALFRKVRQDLVDDANRTFVPNPKKFSPMGLGPMGGYVP